MKWTGSKIACALAGAFSLIGVVMVIASLAVTISGASPNYEADDTSKATLTVEDNPDEPNCGYAIYAPITADCNTFYNGLSVTKPAGAKPGISNVCLFQGDPKEEGDKQLQLVAHLEVVDMMGQTVPGDYVLSSSGGNFWALDWCAQVVGFFKALGQSIVIVIFSFVAFCIACGCCCTSCCLKKPEVVPETKTVVVVGGATSVVPGEPSAVVVKAS